MSDILSTIGTVNEIAGDATVMRVDGTTETLHIGIDIHKGDVIETAENGAVNITFIDDTSFAVSENSHLTIDEYVFDPKTESGQTDFSVLKGMFVYTSGLIGRDDPDDVTIDTPVGSIGIRGTIIAGNIDNGEITVVEGAIVLRDFDGNEVTLANQFETARFDVNNNGDGIHHMGQMEASEVTSKFSGLSDVAPTLFSSIEDVAGEQQSNDQEAAKDAEPDQQQDPEDAREDNTETEAKAEDSRPEGTAEEPSKEAVKEDVNQDAKAEEPTKEQRADAARKGEHNEDAKADSKTKNDARDEAGEKHRDSDKSEKQDMEHHDRAHKEFEMQPSKMTGTEPAETNIMLNGINDPSLQTNQRTAGDTTQFQNNIPTTSETVLNPQVILAATDQQTHIESLKANNSPDVLHDNIHSKDYGFLNKHGAEIKTFEFSIDHLFTDEEGSDLNYQLSQKTIHDLNRLSDDQNILDNTTGQITSPDGNVTQHTKGWSFDAATGKITFFVNDDFNIVGDRFTFDIEVRAWDGLESSRDDGLETPFPGASPSFTTVSFTAYEAVDGNGTSTIQSSSIISTDSSSDVIYASSDNVNITVQGDSDDATVFAKDGVMDQTIILSGSADNTVFMGEGNKTLFIDSSSQNNTLVGGNSEDGDDSFTIKNVNNKIHSMGGNDTFTVEAKYTDLAYGNAEDRVLDGGEGFDSITLINNGVGDQSINFDSLLIQNIEKLTLSGNSNGDLHLDGNAVITAENVLQMTDQDNTLELVLGDHTTVDWDHSAFTFVKTEDIDDNAATDHSVLQASTASGEIVSLIVEGDLSAIA